MATYVHFIINYPYPSFEPHFKCEAEKCIRNGSIKLGHVSLGNEMRSCGIVKLGNVRRECEVGQCLELRNEVLGKYEAG